MPKSSDAILDSRSKRLASADQIPDLERVADVGRQLRSAFQQLFEGFPGHAKSVAGMTRWLGVGRSACQRIMLGVREQGDPLEVIERFPGVRGFNQFIEAVRKKGVDDGRIAAAVETVKAYEALIGEAGGSHARLVTHIVRNRQAGSAGDGKSRRVSEPPAVDDTRRIGFNVARQITGLQCRARVDVHVIRPTVGDPTLVERASATGFIGIEAADYAMPFVHLTSTFSGESVSNGRSRATHDATTSLHEGVPQRGFTPRILIPEFSSSPPPTITTRDAPGKLVQVFNPEGALRDPTDIVIGTVLTPEGEHPALSGRPSYTMGTIIGVPMRFLLSDIYMHRSMAQASIPDFGVYRLGFAGAENVHPRERWYDRLPDEMNLLHLGPGVGQTSSAAYRRICELSQYLVEEAGWPSEEFVGYRIAVPYPIWGAQYVVWFDFAREE